MPRFQYTICDCGRYGGEPHAHWWIDGERFGSFPTVGAALLALLGQVNEMELDQDLVEATIDFGEKMLRVLRLTDGEDADYEKLQVKLQEAFPALRLAIEDIFSEVIAEEKAADELDPAAIVPPTKVLLKAS